MNMEQKLAAIAAYAKILGFEAEMVKEDGVDMVEVMVKSRRNGSVSPRYVCTMNGFLSAVGGHHDDGTEI